MAGRARARDAAGAEQEPDILAELQAEVAQELADERPPAGGAAYQVVSAVVVLVLGIGAAYLAYGYGLGSLRRPGPGLWPFAVSIADRRARRGPAGHRPHASTTRRSSPGPASWSLAGGATFVGLGLLLPTIGFEIPAARARASSGSASSAASRWRSTIVIALCTTAAFYLLFLYALRIPLPHLLAF